MCSTSKCMQSKNMAMASTKALTFKVTRKNQELISPEKSTPYQFKHLSDIDDNIHLRYYIPVIYFYKNNPYMEGKDPVSILRDAVAKALVFYYPVAGRLREYAGGKLVVECTGDGVLFVEADADIMLHKFGDSLCPPFPYLEHLLPNVDNEVVNSPLLIIQVTRLKCGGFIFACRFCHVMFDATGFVQFMTVVAELARGATAPSIPPAWERHLLTARSPPECPSGTASTIRPAVLMVETLTPPCYTKWWSATYSLAPPTEPSVAPYRHISRRCSAFDIVAACVWRCRTIALFPELPEKEVRFMCAVDVRKQMKPPLPVGYYGNVLSCPAAVTSAEKLWKNPLGYAVELVRKTKYQVTDEYIRSVADLMVIADRPGLVTEGSYVVSDLTKAGAEQVDYGWGTAAYGGIAKLTHEFILSWYLPFKNNTTGEQGILVPACLPETAMEVFAKQLQMMITSASITSAL